MTKKEKFVSDNWLAALAVEKEFGMNPIVMLAQAAHESAWGNSYGAKNRYNFFGITAAGSPNRYWDGQKSKSTASGLWFRIYDNAQKSFLDFSRLIKAKYTSAFAQSYNIDSYATAIAQSSYISESNGDNRTVYRKSILQNATFIQDTVKKLSLLAANTSTNNTKPSNNSLDQDATGENTNVRKIIGGLTITVALIFLVKNFTMKQ